MFRNPSSTPSIFAVAPDFIKYFRNIHSKSRNLVPFFYIKFPVNRNETNFLIGMKKRRNALLLTISRWKWAWNPSINKFLSISSILWSTVKRNAEERLSKIKNATDKYATNLQKWQDKEECVYYQMKIPFKFS